jgi:hypothetical protein
MDAIAAGKVLEQLVSTGEARDLVDAKNLFVTRGMSV